MAGMLPGVEAARRRRFHKTSHVSSSDHLQATSSSSSSRRYSFCLYATAHDHQYSNSTMTRNINPSARQVESRIMCDESKLSGAAREAKKRLDERLQLPPRSQNMNTHTRPTSSSQSISAQDYNLKRLSWLKRLIWKSQQDECAVCLEHLRSNRGGAVIMQLPCGHRFHTNCLLPWLQANAHCPCCRLQIPSSSSHYNN